MNSASAVDRAEAVQLRAAQLIGDAPINTIHPLVLFAVPVPFQSASDFPMRGPGAPQMISGSVLDWNR